MAQRLPGIFQNAGDQLLEMMTYPCDALGEEKVGIVYKGNLETVFLFFKGKSQVEFAAPYCSMNGLIRMFSKRDRFAVLTF